MVLQTNIRQSLEPMKFLFHVFVRSHWLGPRAMTVELSYTLWRMISIVF